MSGAIGIHVEANSEGYSRDRAVQCARNIGGGFATIVNDPQLCMMLLDVGVTPIHRINRQGLLDDNQQQYHNTREYIRTAHIEVPDKRALLYWNNEPGQMDLARLNEAALEAMDEARQLGRTLCILNWSYGNPEPAAWDAIAPAVRAAAAGGHYVGFHEGTDLQHPTLASCYPDLIGRFLKAKQRFGFQALVTEFAASRDAWHGWQTWDSDFARTCDDTVREVYAPNGVYMTPFTAFLWHEGFDYINSPALQAAWAETNRRYPVSQTINPPTSGGVPIRITGLPPGVPFRNIRTQPRSDALDVGDLNVGDLVTAYTNALTPDNWCYLERGADGVTGWTLWTGVEYETVTPPSERRISWSVEEVAAFEEAVAAFLAKGVPSSDSGGTF